MPDSTPPLHRARATTTRFPGWDQMYKDGTSDPNDVYDKVLVCVTACGVCYCLPRGALELAPALENHPPLLFPSATGT